jgi:DNA-binding Lrp family transcriptional regulator
MPKIHSEAIVALAKHPVRYLLGVAQYIGLHLGKENPTTVVLRISQITDELGLSEPSVVKAIKLLEELKYVENTGKSSYRVSPNLAFYGTNIEWSLAIQMEAEGKTNEEFLVAKDSINKQLRENEMLAGIKEA